MDVEVRLFATLREGRFGKKSLELPEGIPVREVLDRLAIQSNEVSIVLINGKEGDIDRSLASGDVLSLFPAVGGG